MEFFAPRDGWDTPDPGDLGIGVRAVYEVVVEGVTGAATHGSLDQSFTGVGARMSGQRLSCPFGRLCARASPRSLRLRCHNVQEYSVVIAAGGPERTSGLQRYP